MLMRRRETWTDPFRAKDCDSGSGPYLRKRWRQPLCYTAGARVAGLY
jgi:hypothetical protein